MAFILDKVWQTQWSIESRQWKEFFIFFRTMGQLKTDISDLNSNGLLERVVKRRIKVILSLGDSIVGGYGYTFGMHRLLDRKLSIFKIVGRNMNLLSNIYSKH
jgi:hypothetical protein